MNRFIKSLSVVLLIAMIGCEKAPDNNNGEAKFERYIKEIKYPTTNAGLTASYGILLPEAYESETEARYPVVYMLHGYGEHGKDWSSWISTIKTLESQGLQDMIYVFPNCGNSYYCNYYNNDARYMDLITKDLVPLIDETYRTIADKRHRAVMGYSMGGFGAMVLPLKNPDIFSISVPLSMSFRTDEQYMTESQSGWDSQWGKIFGGRGKQGEARLTDYYKEHCPFYQFIPENKESLSQVSWFFHCGDDEEQLLIANDMLHVQLRDYEFKHEFRIGDGGHSGSYWRTAARETLPWIQHIMNDGGEWNKVMDNISLKNPDLNEDGTFASKAYKEATEKDGLATYFVHKGLSDEVVFNCMGLLSQSGGIFQYMILPCDLEEKTLSEWMIHYKSKYEVGKSVEKSQVIAIGQAGQDVWKQKDEFKGFYLIDTPLAEDKSTIIADSEKHYYIETVDDSPNYKDLNALYVSCKKVECDFEYRMRNSVSDKQLELMIAIQNASKELKFR